MGTSIAVISVTAVNVVHVDPIMLHLRSSYWYSDGCLSGDRVLWLRHDEWFLVTFMVAIHCRMNEHCGQAFTLERAGQKTVPATQ